jgi:1,4-alpha-glucan branching enzyme
MEEKGFLLIVLHTHLPFIRHPEMDYASEEDWLFEALVECYLPLLEAFEGLAQEGVPFRVTMSLTPPLLEMWSDPLLQERFSRYLDDHTRLAEREIARLAGEPEMRRLARLYRDRFTRSGALFHRRWRGDLAAAFRRLAEAGHLEILASAATHAYLPLWQTHPEAVELQVRAGVRHYEEAFGRPPAGFWLPECGFYPGLDTLLWQAGLSYVFLDSHGVLHSTPRPRRGLHAPVHCPSGLAAFGRESFCHHLVWQKEGGYPGEAAYLDHRSDIGYELPIEELQPFTRCAHRVPTGLRYRRVGSAHHSDVYDPDLALQRCHSHAEHFAAACQGRVEDIYRVEGRKPVLVALFDTEHFGHWWHEGPIWLSLALRRLAGAAQTVRLTTATEYLEAFPTHQVVRPHLSSWGYQGYSETWLMGSNHWPLPMAFKAFEDLRTIDCSAIDRPCAAWAALDQALRELMLAQASDWAFIIHTHTAAPYATRRLESHLGNVTALVEQLKSGVFDSSLRDSLAQRNSIFSGLDLAELYCEVRDKSGP